MPASLHEVQALVDRILELQGARISTGQVVIHMHDGHVMTVAVNTIYKIQRQAPMRKT